MIQNNADDTWKLSPKGIDVVRTGGPRGGQSEDFIVCRDDGYPKSDSDNRRQQLSSIGHYIQGRNQD